MSELASIYTEAEVAGMFGLDEARAAKLRRAEKWPHFKVGRAVRYTAAQVEQIIADHTAQPAPAAEQGEVLPLLGLVRTPRSAGRKRSA